MVKTFADALMSAEADALCNAEYGQISEERVNHRNGYRPCSGRPGPEWRPRLISAPPIGYWRRSPTTRPA
jgi:hypothetical protein